MAYLNVLYINHIDLTWRRPRYSAAKINEYQLVPYAEIQENQIDAGIDFARQGGCYGIEQTISLREYLDRNPDTEPEIKKMLDDGRLSLLGGGESVIDYNLPDGEGLVRNHLYSKRWLKHKFGYEPTLACCPDTFGLSGNLPALFRGLGYKGISQYSRVFEGAKPVWQGISGDRILLESAKISKRPLLGMGSFVKSRVCDICRGSGGSCCSGYGFILVQAPQCADAMDNMLDAIFAAGRSGDVNLMINGEESVPPEGAIEKLRMLAAKAGLEIRFTGLDELICENFGEMLDGVDSLPCDMVDPRLEGNPVAAGCYTSRIKLKQEYRRCEAALIAAERLATIASLKNLVNPVKTFEQLWLKMAFIQFHDALPASHSDDAYAELMETGRQIRASASRIINRSVKLLKENINIPDHEGIPFIVFNPLEFDVKNALLDATVTTDRHVQSGTVIAPDGSRLALLSAERSNSPESGEVRISFIGSLPAFGYGVFRFIPSDEELVKPEVCRRGVVMENEFLRVELDCRSVKAITDKRSGRLIAGAGSFAPEFSDDAGHPWGRTNHLQYRDRADLPVFWENMMPSNNYSHEVKYCRRGNLQIASLHLTYDREEKQIYSLDWTASFILADGSDSLRVKITTAFDARDIKLSTILVLPEAPRDGKIDYEIPLGRIARGSVQAYNDQLGYSDEWPALRYVSACCGEQKITLCNSGTPGHSVDGQIIRVSLLRTPTQMCCGYGIKGAIDRSVHSFSFTLSAEQNSIDQYRRGMILNSYYPSFKLDCRNHNSAEPVLYFGSFINLPNQVPLLALKGAEDGNGCITRYLGKEETVLLNFENSTEECSLIEEGKGVIADSFEIKPYEIKTLRHKKENLSLITK